MTMREQDLIILAIARERLQQQQMAMQAVMAGAGSLFSKQGDKSASKEFVKLDRDLEKQMAESLGVHPNDLAVERGSLKEHTARVNAKKRQQRAQNYSHEDFAADIAVLDQTMSAITGQVHQNPAAAGP